MLPAFSVQAPRRWNLSLPPSLCGSHFCIGGGARIEKSRVLQLNLRDPHSPSRPRATPPRRGPAARAPFRRPWRQGHEEGPPGAQEAAQALLAGHQRAAHKFTGRPGRGTAHGAGSRVPSPARPPPPPCPRSRWRGERTRPRGAPQSTQHPNPPAPRAPAGQAPSSTLLARGPWGREGWAGSPRRDGQQPPRAHLHRSVDGRRKAPRPRGVGDATGGPGGCAARRLPTFPPLALPGEPTGRAASAPVRTRRAAFHRGRRRRVRAGRGREEMPAGGPAAGLPRRPEAAAAPGSRL